MTYKLPEGWKETKLGEVTKKIGSGSTPRGGSKVYISDGINFIRSQNVLDFSFSIEGLVKIDDDAAKKLDNVEVVSKDVLINITGDSVARACLVPDLILPARVNQHVSIIRSDETLSYYKYIYYQLHYLKNQLLSYASSGATRKALTKSMLENLEIKLPTLNEQKSIAHTLSSLDNKIELNNKINQNLEQQAQAIFKHWFVDFEFPDENGNPYKSSGGEMVESELGMIPNRWELDKLGNRLNVELGGTPSRKNESYWNGDINWINSGELNSYRIFKETEKITKDGLKNSSTKLWTKNTTVIAITGATLGKTSLLLIDTCANQSVVGIKENSNIPYTFVYPYIISKIPELTGHQTGGAQQHVNKGNVEDLILLLPTKDLLLKYNNIIKSHYKLIEMNEFQNIKLSQLRDTLLPKLMSGELRIPLN